MTPMGGSGMVGDVLAVLPEAILLLGAVACLLLGSWTPRQRLGRVRALAALVAFAVLVTGVLGLLRDPVTAFSGTVLVDVATGVVRVVVAAALLGLLVLASTELAGHPREGEVYVLMLLGADGVLLLAAATDLVVLVAAFLLASIPLYGLIGLSSPSNAPEAAVKTYLVGALCGILLMLGAALLLGLTGSAAYPGLSGLARSPGPAAAAGVLLVLTGLLFKAGAVPAHFWVPDAVTGSWVTSAAFLTTVPKMGAVVAVARLVEHLPPGGPWPVVVAVVAAVGMSIGNLGALTQRDVRRLLAWSTISQVGYLLAAAAAVTGSGLARPALLLFVAGYAVTNLACFAVLAVEPRRTDVDAWRGYGRRQPVVVGALGTGLLGLVGTPPTAVFVAKLLTIGATWEAGWWWLAALVALNTVVSLAYYLRWLASALSAEEPGTPPPGPAGSAGRLAVTCAVLAVALGLAAAPVLALAG